MKSLSQKLASMTGYARSTASVEGANIQCEIKSVNARGLDIRLRLGSGLDVLEPKIRRLLGEKLTRGSVSCTLTVQRDNGEGQLVINQQALGTVLDALDALSGKIEADRPRLDGILAIKGVLEIRDVQMNSEMEAELHKAILEQVEICLDDLLENRQSEGARLRDVLSDHVETIATLTQLAYDHPARHRDFFANRLGQQIEALTDSGAGLSPDRLHQEALILATRADICEELDRLFSHIKSARQLLARGGAVGRKLDFLAQEFNREANTLCSKSHAVELTTIGLDMKSAVDQLREQIQNIE